MQFGLLHVPKIALESPGICLHLQIKTESDSGDFNSASRNFQHYIILEKETIQE